MGGWFVAAVPGDNGCENDLQEGEVAAKATVEHDGRKPEVMMQTPEKMVKMERRTLKNVFLLIAD